MFPYDDALLALIATPAQTVDDVLRMLHAIDSACVDADGLKWFNWLYMGVTEAVAARIAAGGFRDPAWLAQLDVQFAGFYFEALSASLRGEPAPECWRVLFERRNHYTIARIQFALAGVNAHINHDLAEAIVTTCRLTGTTPGPGTHFDDYNDLNPTLDARIAAAKTALNVRLPGTPMGPINHLADTLAAWNVIAAREGAWLNAVHLWQLKSFPSLAASFLNVLDGLATVIGKTLLVPVP